MLFANSEMRISTISGWTFLYVLNESGRPEVLQLLTTGGEDCTLGGSAYSLIGALKRERRHIFVFLLQHGAELDETDPTTGRTAM